MDVSTGDNTSTSISRFHDHIPDAESTGLSDFIEEAAIPADPVDQSFNCSLPVQNIPPQEVSALEPAALPDDLLQDVPLTFEILQGASRRGGDLLSDSHGFLYNKRRVTGVATTWICTSRTSIKCYATVSQRGDNFTRGPKAHHHPADPESATTHKVHALVKKTARSELYKTAGSVVNEVLAESTEPKDYLPKFDNMQRHANRVRAQMRPKNPSDLNFELQPAHVPEGFLQHDLRVGDHRHLIFATALQLKHLAKAKLWCIDATFRVVGKPFHQLLSIHSFIRSGNTMKQVPLCFVIMSQRKTGDYEAVLRTIIQHLPTEPSVREVMVDFERAAWRAFERVLPDVDIRGCWFHWAQAVFRKVKEIGLRQAYVHQGLVRDYIRELMALPNLPANHIAPTFAELRTRCPPGAARLDELLQYIDKTWVSSNSRPPTSWSTFQRLIRTNNDAEGWHNRLNKQAVNDHMNLYQLIALLHKEAELLPYQVTLVSQHKLYRHRKKDSDSKEKALKELWALYCQEDREISTTEYLRRCSQLSEVSED